MPNNNTFLIPSVTKAVNILYTALIQKLSGAEYPSKIAENTRTLPVTVNGGEIKGSVAIDLLGAPMAAAYEWGSGIWSERGPRQKYPIVPVNATKLAFDWPEAANIGSREGVRDIVTPVSFNQDTNSFDGGRAVLPLVMHPGIRAKPYITPTINLVGDSIADTIGDDVLMQISLAIGPDVTVIR